MRVNVLMLDLTPNIIADFIRKIACLRLYWAWKRNGCPVPPPHLAKQNVISEYRVMFNLEVLVETGTYEGETIQSQLHNFKKIISIEVVDDLYRKALKRFKKHSHVKVYHGDSGEVLKAITPELASPCLFWLDGHYSGGITGRVVLDTPIKSELETIFNLKFPHVVLIDDARCFNGENGYPTLSELGR